MSTAELKIDLINQITNLTDSVKIKDLLQLIKFQSDDSIYTTSESEKKEIFVARKQIENGETIPNESLQKEINEWLTK
jgi:hypothetical protein